MRRTTGDEKGEDSGGREGQDIASGEGDER